MTCADLYKVSGMRGLLSEAAADGCAQNDDFGIEGWPNSCCFTARVKSPL